MVSTTTTRPAKRAHLWPEHRSQRHSDAAYPKSLARLVACLHFFSSEINNIGATVPCMHYQRCFAADIPTPTHAFSATHNHDGVCFKVKLTFRMLHTSMLIVVLTIWRIESYLQHLSLTQPSSFCL